MNTLYRSFNVLHECETTIETNPNTVTLPMLKSFSARGLTGYPSARNPLTRSSCRSRQNHTFDQVTNAVNAARAAKIENISLT